MGHSMALDASPPWCQKATAFFASSGARIKQAGQSPRGNVADVAGKVNSMVKNMWAVFKDKRQSKQERATSKETVQERLISVAALTTVLLRKGSKKDPKQHRKMAKGCGKQRCFWCAN